MGILQFLVFLNIFNIHLRIVQLKDLPGDHHVDDTSKSISNIYEERVPSQKHRRSQKSSAIIQLPFKLGWEADEIVEHSLSPPAEAVITIPFDRNILLEPNINSSNRQRVPSILSLRSIPPCTSEQFACADGTSCIPKSWLCTGYAGCNDLCHLLPSQCTMCTL